MDNNIEVLKILNNISNSVYQAKKSNLVRIQNNNQFNTNAQKDLISNIIAPLDDSLFKLSVEINKMLNVIPIYNLFLKNVDGVSIYDAANLICIVKDIDRFDDFGALLAYSGFIPNAKSYNKNLHKLLLKISYKLSNQNLIYQFVFENHYEIYKKKYPERSDEHIENMAKRIVTKRFLQNLYTNWVKINNF
jgi:hypothetical protein